MPNFSRIITIAFLSISILSGCASLSPQARHLLDERRERVRMGQREATVAIDAVAYRSGEDGPEGSLIPMTIEVRPNNTSKVRIAVYEEYSGGTGDQWRASVWLAAIHATKHLNVPLNRHAISVSSNGMIDGPSAGALITSALMAVLKGQDVLSTTTMTGTINPDGTVGPVGGIAYKMTAAAEDGKKVFGYPAGLRIQHLADGTSVDLQEHAARLGIEAVEISDIHDAYKILTGEALSKVPAVQASRMVPSAAHRQHMQEMVALWGAIVKQGLNEYLELDARIQPFAKSHVTKAMATWNESERYLNQGLTSIGYKRARDAAMYAQGIGVSARVMSAAIAGDLSTLSQELDAADDVEGELNYFLAQAHATKASTVGEALVLMGAYETVLQAYSMNQRAEMYESEALAALKQSESLKGTAREEVITSAAISVAGAVFWYQSTHLYLVSGRAGIEVGMSNPSNAKLDVKHVKSLAQSTTIAAKAMLDYYKSTSLDPLASAVGVTSEQLQGRMQEVDSRYRTATVGLTYALTSSIKGADSKDLNKSLFILAAAETALLEASFLVMRDYSLDAVKDRSGKVVSVKKDLAFMHALDAAELKARESAAFAKKRLGSVPDTATTIYQRARILRDGDVDEKLNSLQGYWIASMQSQTAAYLAGW